MKITIDNRDVEVFPGMTVGHAVISVYGEQHMNPAVKDRWGNIVGISGEVTEGA